MRFVVLSLVLSVLYAPTAQAGCAWILWEKTGFIPRWSRVTAYPDYPRCYVEFRERSVAQRVGGKKGASEYLCLPDTVPSPDHKS